MLTETKKSTVSLSEKEVLRFALPSDRAMEEDTLRFLQFCGLPVERLASRRYIASIPSVEGVSALFQRSVDIPQKVEERVADLAILGLDRWLESRTEGGNSVLVMEDLGFSQCELVVAVPETWIDVESMADLEDLALEFRQRGRELRVATKYPRLTQQFFLSRNITYFDMVAAAGAMEAAPAAGYADIITDIMTSGATLRENHLKTLEDGAMVKSQACLIANVRSLKSDPRKLARTRAIVELIEARLRAQQFYSITANVRGSSEEALAKAVLRKPSLAGMKGPTVAKVYAKQGGQRWYAVTVVIPVTMLSAAVDHLREIGASSMTVVPVQYVYQKASDAFSRLEAQLFGGRRRRSAR